MAFQGKQSLRGASSWKPCAFQWRSCSLQLLLSSALEKPIPLHGLTLLLSSTGPFKEQLQDLLPSSTNSQKQLLSYTTIPPKSRSKIFPLSHCGRTSASHGPAHCLECKPCQWQIDRSTFTCLGAEREKSWAGKILHAQFCQTQALLTCLSHSVLFLASQNWALFPSKKRMGDTRVCFPTSKWSLNNCLKTVTVVLQIFGLICN